MTAQTVENEIAKAEQAAQDARDKAREMRAQQEAEAAEAARRRRVARAEFEERRRVDFPRTYGRAVREARDAFNEAVATGADAFGAWTRYQGAIAVAASEEGRIAHYQHRRATEAYEQTLAKYTALADRLRPFTAQHSRYAGAAQPDARLAETNRAINELAGTLGSSYHRADGDLDEMAAHQLGIERPRNIPMSVGDATKWEKRTFTRAFDDAVHAAATRAAAEHDQQVRQEIDALTR